mmetsp:Transcript_30625/g.58057  ORF Transcript_30625/g.58057 Transcript_30625/m.58057 type:complete len:838 (+) Transcript_30625:58-2571(+)
MKRKCNDNDNRKMKADLIFSRTSYHAGTPIVGTVRIHRTIPKHVNISDNTTHRTLHNDSNSHNDDDDRQQQRPQQQQQQSLPIRNEIVSARLYLTGRSHLGSTRVGVGSGSGSGGSGGGGGKAIQVVSSSRWRSAQEINHLKKIYGEEHPCLTLAKMDEISCWNDEWNNHDTNSHSRRRRGRGKKESNNDNNDADGSRISSDKDDDSELLATTSSKKTTFCRPIEPPSVSHIEQAERFAVHSFLHPSSASSAKTNNNNGSKRSNINNDSKYTQRQQQQQQQRHEYSHLPTPQENNSICFWMTNVLELLNVPERHLNNHRKYNNAHDEQLLRPGRGRFHADMYPYRPLQLPDLDVVKDVWKDIEKNRHVVMGKDNGVEGGEEEEESSSLSSNGSDSVELPSRIDKSCETVNEGIKSTTTKSAILTKPMSAWEKIIASSNASNNEASPNKYASGADSNPPLEEMQLALSFRADLPPNIPPTMSCRCVKYFYSAVLVVTTADGELLVTHCPFTVLASTSSLSSTRKSNNQTSSTTMTRVHIGDLHAIAHSPALPAYVSSTEASDATLSQLTVVPNPPACDIVSRRTAESRTSTHRIQDGAGCLVGWMTLVGLGGPLVPGTRLGIRITFPPIYDDDDENGDNASGGRIIPCHRVCCALVGEEYAIFEGDVVVDNPQKGKKRVKTRSYVFDSAYEMVEFGYTEAVSMGLVLPLDCPGTVKTDLVEVTVMLKVEFTVGRASITGRGSDNGGAESSSSTNPGEFSVIRLDLPCEVVHEGGGSSSSYPEDGEEEDEQRISSIRTMQQFWNDDNKADADSFDDTDIQTDLKMLSLRMIGELQTGMN